MTKDYRLEMKLSIVKKMADGETESLKIKHRKYTLKFKQEVILYAKQNSVNAAANKFGIHRKSVQEWKQQEARLIDIQNPKKRFRLEGNGRKIKHDEVEAAVLQFFKEMRDKKLRVTRGRLRHKAREIYLNLSAGTDTEEEGQFVASEGWMTKFLDRNGLVLRRSTTVCQKPPADYIEKILKFFVYVRSLRERFKYPDNCIIACDETAIWYDALSNSTLAAKGSKEVAVRSTGHSKSRITVMLSAKGDGTKLKPYILLPRKRAMPDLVAKYGGRVDMTFEGTNWMNQELTEDYLSKVIGFPMFTPNRLLVWDSFKCHISEATKKAMKRFKVHSAVIPGGCTGFVQAPDVCWNKPFKDVYTKCYDEWLESGKQDFTAGGNPKAAPLEEIVRWVIRAWDSLSPSLIRDSFKACGLTNNLDQSEDDQILVFKEGKCCAGKLDDFSKMMQDRTADDNDQFSAH